MGLLDHRLSRFKVLVAEDLYRSASETGALLGSGPGLSTDEHEPASVHSVTVPAIRWARHESVIVRSDLPALLRGRRLLAGSLLLDALERSETPVSKNSLLSSDGMRVRVRRTGKSRRIEAGVFLGGFAPRAYFHHLCERISRLALLDLMPSDLSDLPILVPEETLRIKSLVDATRLLAPGQELLPMSWEDEYRVGQAVWIDEVHRWGAGFPGVFTHIEGMSRFRTRILQRLGITPQVEPGLRLYLDRGERRRSERASEYRTWAERAGFRIWRPEQESFADQVATWSRVEAVTGESGAAWSGTLFAPEGSRGLVVTDGTASGWPHLGRVSGMDVRLIVPRDAEQYAGSLRALVGG